MKRQLATAGLVFGLAGSVAAGSTSARADRPARPTVAMAATLEVRDASELGGAEWLAPNGRGRVALWKAGPSGWELLIAGPKLGDARRVYRTPRSPGDVALGRVLEWSPSGEQLAFCAPAAGRGGSRVYVVGADGSGLRCLTAGARSEYDPCWSPDGEWVALLQEGGASRPHSVWAVRVDGSGRQRLLDDAALPVATRAGRAKGQPLLRWSEDGARISWKAQPLYLGMAGR
jgi:hypothetical protein